MFARQLRGSHKDLSIKNNLKYKVSASIVNSWRWSLLECFIEVKPSVCHVLGATTICDNASEMFSHTLPSPLINAYSVSLIMVWNYRWPKCGNIFPEFLKLPTRKRTKAKALLIWGNTRRQGQGSFLQNGKLAGRGESMMRKEWFIIPSSASRTNQLWSHRMCLTQLGFKSMAAPLAVATKQTKRSPFHNTRRVQRIAQQTYPQKKRTNKPSIKINFSGYKTVKIKDDSNGLGDWKGGRG